MTPIKHLLNNVLEMKSNKNNLKQGDVFLNNKKRFMGFNKIEGFTCNDENVDDLSYDGHYNVRDKFGNNYYYANENYYKYENDSNQNTFKPTNPLFSNTCPKTPQRYKEYIPYVKGNINPLVDTTVDSNVNKKNICPKYGDDDTNSKKYYCFKKNEKDENEKRQKRIKGSNTKIVERNKKAILLSHKINEYNKLVEQSKKISNDIMSYDTSRGDFLKSVAALQIQYGVVGLTSIALVYLTIKMMSNKT
jgi:hypothetical protein